MALSRLRELLAADFVAQVEALVVAGWDADDAADAALSYSVWAHGWLAEAIADGLERWGGLS